MMEAIQVQVPAELAQRLRGRYDDLPEILEWGLRHVEAQDQGLQKQIEAALRQAGATGPEPEIMEQYIEEQKDWAPIPSSGKPASEMIVEERKGRLGDE